MNIENAVWLAGLFEGDGTTGLFKNRRKSSGKWRISTYFLICNNDPLLIQKVEEIANEIGVDMYKVTRHQDGNEKDWNKNFQVAVKNFTGTYAMLELIEPYLVGTKKAIANMTMEFIESRDFGNSREPYTDFEHKLQEKCHKYTKRGSEATKFKSSETLRQTLAEILGGEEKVQTSMRVGDKISTES